MTPYEQLGDSWKDKLPVNRKEPPAEPGSQWGGHLGSEGRKTGQRRTVGVNQRMKFITND